MVKSSIVVHVAVLSHTLSPFVNIFYILVLPIRFPENGTSVSWTIIQITDCPKTFKQFVSLYRYCLHISCEFRGRYMFY